MAIESIKSNVVSQVNRVSEPVTVDSGENVQVKPQQVAPVTGRQSGYEPKDGQEKENNANDEGKNLSEVSPEKIKNAVSEINKKIRLTHTQCEFKFHEKTNRIMITVKDSETDEVIKEIPPEKTLDMIAKSLELAGLLVDEKR
ncbi:MAG: flagellar protein FlaG [Lachnospiraceae bacterium]|nr:flagellar protein FlaG [Lachnospiraceae bacterium]